MAKTKRSKPLPEVLPPYIVERDDIARRAGLTVEHSWGGYLGEELLSVYRGSRAQLVASPFIEDKEGVRFPRDTRHCVKTGVATFESPGDSHLVGAFNAEDGTCYVKYLDQIPAGWGELENGTLYFTFEGWRRRAVFRGPRRSLVLDAVETDEGLRLYLPEDEPGSESARRERCGDYTFTVAHYRVIEGDVVEVVKYPDAEREYEEHKRDGGATFQNEDEFRGRVQFFFELTICAMRDQMTGETQRRDGVQYRYDSKAVRAAMEALERIRESVDLGRIERREPPPCASLQAPISLDVSASFERFMAKAIGSGGSDK